MRIRKRMATLVVALAMVGAAFTAFAPAASAGTIELHWNVNATTHIAKSDSDVNVTGGRFDGTINTDTGALSGAMSLPETTLTMNLLGAIPAADVTVKISPVGRTTGHVDFATFFVTTKSVFNIRVTKVVPHGTDQNIVGDKCKTETPITIRLGGVAALDKPSSFSGTFTIPEFADCQLFEVLINQLIPGPGNTFTATFAPEGQTPPPPPPAEPAPAPAPPPAAEVKGGLNFQVGDQVIETPPLDLTLPPLAPPAPAPGGGGGGGGVLPGVPLPLPPLFTVD
jgi:hypothetical protein